MDDSHLCIGLFGTCGGSKWRDQFMSIYDEKGIVYYNPQVEDWTPECAVEEAAHLANDAIVLFPVTNETYAFGSLAETGFSMLQAIRLDDRRDFVVFIDQSIATHDPLGNVLDDRFNEDGLTNPQSRARESLRARALVRQHLLKLRLPNVYVAKDLTEMLSISLKLWEAALIRWPLKAYNPQ